MDPNGTFQTEMVRYLKAAHQGKFSGGSVDKVRMKVATAEAKLGYSDLGNSATSLLVPKPIARAARNVPSSESGGVDLRM